MKTIITLVCTSLMLFYACGQSIKGNGKVTKETRTVKGGFEKITVAGPFKVFINEGETDGKITIESDSNLIEHIEVKVVKNALTVQFEEGYSARKAKKMEIRFSANNLSAIMLSGSGKVEQQGINDVSEFKVVLAGSGNIVTGVNAKNVKLSTSGSGNIKIKGNTESVEVAVSGSGDVDAKTLKSKTAKVAIAGSSDVEIYASKSINAAISGSGDVLVHGDPSNINSRSKGSGKVTKA